MGNVGSSSSGRRRQGSRRSHPPPPAHPEIRANNIVFAAASPYPTRFPHPPSGYYQYHLPAGYYPPHPGPMQLNWAGTGEHFAPPPPLEHQKAVTIRNDVNLKKDTLRVEPDEENPGKYLVSFTFDATLPGSLSVIYFAKEDEECNLTPTKENLLPQVTVQFEQGLGQKFRQPSGTGIDFSMFEESELMKVDMDVCPLAVKAYTCPLPKQLDMGSDDSPLSDSTTTNSQITQAVFDKDKGEYKVKVVKQILWVNRMRYELHEIYGIGKSVEGSEVDDNDPGKECVICLSEPRDTTVLPCRHMCMCSGCAKVLRFQTNRCPICRQPVERLLEIKVSNRNEEEKATQSAH